MTPDTGTVTVRDAGPADLEAVGRLTVAAYEEYAAVIAPSFWGRYREDLGDAAGRAGRATILVADADGELAGSVALSPSEGASGWWPEGWAGVRALAVAPGHRRRGIGRLLMEACVERAQAQGAVAIGLNTVEYMAAAIRLYEAMGFVRVPALEHVTESGRLLYAFGMELRPGALAAAAERG